MVLSAWVTLLLSSAARLPAADRLALWDESQAIPNAVDLPVLRDVTFHVIKRYEFSRDGYRFLHGVALAWHQGRLYASFGHNRGGENTDTEEARVCHSDDGGKTWSPITTIDAGDAPGVGISHGVFLSHQGRLWAFHGAYTGTMQDVHTRCYVLRETGGTWEHRGAVIQGGFWPLGEPQRMANGNWIMAGISVGQDNPAAVAISRGDDFTKWDLVVLPLLPGLGRVWGESAVIVAGNHVTNIARYGQQSVALVAVSRDYGRMWTSSQPSNLPMATSKPCAGTLSTGQRFLICCTSADGGGRRSPLTIALTEPGATLFSRVFVIRHAEFPGGTGESHPKAALAYPSAVEHEGKLYVAYSNNGGNVGRQGSGRELWNNNSAELAVIPVEVLCSAP
jgi:hypothetical protein